MAVIKDNKNHWRDKYLLLLEKHTKLGEAILKALENIKAKKKTKTSKDTDRGRWK